MRTSSASNMEPPQQRDQRLQGRALLHWVLGSWNDLVAFHRQWPPHLIVIRWSCMQRHVPTAGAINRISPTGRLPPGAVKKALELEAKISMRERRLLMVYEDKCNEKAEKQLEEDVTQGASARTTARPSMRAR